MTELEVYCKAWPVRISKRFHKPAFALDWERQVIRCPAEQEMPFVPGGVVHFPKGICAQCPLKTQCTTSAKGRSISIHPDEALLIELRERQQTSDGRSQLRERVAVEHTLAHVGQWQGWRARYRGAQESLRFAPVRGRPQSARPGSLSVSTN
jgi:transposase